LLMQEEFGQEVIHQAVLQQVTEADYGSLR
jgi:hypothetical protein